MRSQTVAEKPNPQHASGGEVRSSSSCLAEVSPNSSAVMAFSVLADIADVLAVLRTAVLLARSFKTNLSVDVQGTKNFVISPADDVYQMPVQKILDPIQVRLREIMFSGRQSLVLEASFTAASFLAAGSIAVRVHTGESDQRA
jgi:hypothetical protein